MTLERHARWGRLVGLLVLAWLLVHSLFVVPYLPTNDGPQHVFATYIEDHFGDPGTVYADLFSPTTEFASRGFSLVYGPLADLLGWRAGLTWALAIITFISAFGFGTLVRAVHPARWPLAFVGFPLALTWELYMGFFPFAVGSGVGLFILALAVRWREVGTSRRVLLGGLLLVQAVCHVFSALLTGLVIGTVFVWRAGAQAGLRGALRELARVALMGLPAACVLAGSLLAIRRRTFGAFADQIVVLPLAQKILVLPRFVAPGPWWRALMVVALVATAVLVGAIGLWRRGRGATDRALWVAGVALLALGACTPLHIPNWQFFSPRFFPLGAALCLVTLPIESLPQRWAFPSVAAALFLLAATWLAESGALHLRLAAACADAIAGLSAPVRRHGLWLPMTLAPEGRMSPYPEVSEVPFLAPLRHMPMLYAVVEGGVPPGTFANSAATYPFVTRRVPVPPAPNELELAPLIESDAFGVDLALRARVVDELARYGMRYEGVLATESRPGDVAVLRTRGYETDWLGGSVFIGHFVPCSLDVRIPAVGDIPRVDVEVGAPGARPNVLRYRELPAALAPDASRHIAVPDAPCGEIRVRPHWDRRTDDGRTISTYCSNAVPSGDIPVTVTRTSARVICDGERTGRDHDGAPSRTEGEARP